MTHTEPTLCTAIEACGCQAHGYLHCAACGVAVTKAIVNPWCVNCGSAILPTEASTMQPSAIAEGIVHTNCFVPVRV